MLKNINLKSIQFGKLYECVHPCNYQSDERNYSTFLSTQVSPQNISKRKPFFCSDTSYKWSHTGVSTSTIKYIYIC